MQNPVSPAKILCCGDSALELSRGKFCAPRTVELFVTTDCNHSCAGCHTAAQRNGAPEHLDISIALRLLGEWREIGVRGLEISGVGEPLLYPHIEELLYRAAKLGFSSGILTNGSLLHTIDMELLLRSTRFIRVSYDSSDPDAYKKIHSADCLEKVEKNTAQLVKLRKRSRLKTTLGMKTLLSRHNISQMERTAARAAEIGVDYIQFKALRNSKASLSPAALKKASAALVELQERYAKQPQFAVIGGLQKELLDQPCFLSPLHPVVAPDASLYVCPYYTHHSPSHKIGSLRTKSFSSLWGSAAHKRSVAAIKSEVCDLFDCPLIPFNNFARPAIVDDEMHLDFI